MLYDSVSIPYLEDTLIGLLPFETYIVNELPDPKPRTSLNSFTIYVQ